jgi:RNA polymerase sigma factor (sigma-70 family)
MESNGQADGGPVRNEFSRVTSPTARSENFDEVVLPHLDAAYRLALRLMRNQHDAEDVVQEASLRAFRYFRTFAGGNGRAWFLRIVRNTCFSWHPRRLEAVSDSFDEERHRSEWSAPNPESLLLRTGDATLIARAMGHLPDRFHRLLVLRELEGLSYRELAGVIGVPLGTVMSRLSRAREALRQEIDSELNRSRISERAHSRQAGSATALM